jgi:hypothetical protein
MLIIALERMVVCRMTIYTAWIHDHLGGFGEKRARPHLRVLDTRELGRRTQLIGILGRRRVTPNDKQQ